MGLNYALTGRLGAGGGGGGPPLHKPRQLLGEQARPTKPGLLQYPGLWPGRIQNRPHVAKNRALGHKIATAQASASAACRICLGKRRYVRVNYDVPG